MRRKREGIRGHGSGMLYAMCLLVVSSFLSRCGAYAIDVLEPRDTKNNASLPDPFSFSPSQYWDGIDGQWNTFDLRVGTPSQWVRVLASTASQQTWTVFKQACTDTTCFDSRGRTYYNNDSSTWHDRGYYQLWLEKNLNFTGNGLFGYDTVGLGLPGYEGPTLLNTTVGELVSKDFWLGHFGLNAKPTNFTAFEEPSPSYMTYLFQQNLIPSMSFGYTAGAQYRLATVLASLTLGGYDSSRYVPNDLTFEFAPNTERDIVVGIVDIVANGPTDNSVSLLANQDFDMYIDSTVSELWLPVEVCNAFEDTFGLEYNNATGLYLLSDAVHQNLLARNPSITFTLGQKSATANTVNITLPYAALDLQAKAPYRNLANDTRYFPIRRAYSPKQFILGRTFLQEAYLIVDWERQNFSISQCNWVYGENKAIVPILSPTYSQDGASTPGPTKHTSTSLVIGIAIGCGFLLALIVCGVVGWFWRKRSQKKLAILKAEIESKGKAAAATKDTPPKSEPEEMPTSPISDPEEGTNSTRFTSASNVFPKAELPADSVARPELSTDTDVKNLGQPSTYELPSPAAEVDNTERQIFEMPGDIPVRQEADGRQLSEKESMMVRERMYNGIDPNGPPEVSPVVEEHPRRLVPINPSEVTLVNKRLPVSPITPSTPRTPLDGAQLEAGDTFFQPPSRTPRDGRLLEVEDTLLSPISPIDGSDPTRRRFSYES